MDNEDFDNEDDLQIDEWDSFDEDELSYDYDEDDYKIDDDDYEDDE